MSFDQTKPYKNVDGNNVNLTSDEVSQIQAAEAIWAEGAVQRAKDAQVTMLDLQCKTTIVSGYISSATGLSYTYPNQLTDQMNLSASITRSQLPSTPTDAIFPFKAMDSGGNWAYRNHTATQIQNVGQDAYVFTLEQLEKFTTLAGQVMAAQTVADVQAITW